MKRIKGAAAVALVAGVLFSATAGAAEKESSSVREVRGGVGTVQLKGWTATLVAEVELSESRRQALERIYQIVPELEELFLEGVHEEGEDAWRAILSDRAGEPASGIGYVHASLTFENDTGELIGLNIRNPHWASGARSQEPGLPDERGKRYGRTDRAQYPEPPLGVCGAAGFRTGQRKSG